MPKLAEDKLQRVQRNGLVNIGSRYGGQLVRVRQVSPARFEIELGDFVSRDVFYTPEAEKTLAEFQDWDAAHPDAFLSLEEAEPRIRPEPRGPSKKTHRR